MDGHIHRLRAELWGGIHDGRSARQDDAGGDLVFVARFFDFAIDHEEDFFEPGLDDFGESLS